jgi:Malic enzyme, N-terminal domain
VTALQGIHAIGCAISKLALYTACAGVPPAMCLPICLDTGPDCCHRESATPVSAVETVHAQHEAKGLAVSGAAMTCQVFCVRRKLNVHTRDMPGTDNEELLGSPFYVGARHRRVRGEDYRDLLDETLEASAWSDQLFHERL